MNIFRKRKIINIQKAVENIEIQLLIQKTGYINKINEQIKVERNCLTKTNRDKEYRIIHETRLRLLEEILTRIS